MPKETMDNTVDAAAAPQGIRGGFLHREALHQAIGEAVKKPVVTVIAGAGYGKSTAVSLFFKDKQKRTAWLSLTRLDNIATRFWERFVKALSHAGSADKLMRLGFPESDLALDHFLKILDAEIVEYGQYYIVLDDFYMITNPVILRFFERLTQARIAGLCVVILSRDEPPFQTIALLSKNLLCRLHEDALRLTLEETSGFLKMNGILLTSGAASDFHADADGWFFAVRLACLSLKKNVLYKENPVASIKRDVYSLLKSEVFACLTGEAQALLIKLSLLETLPEGLVALLAGDNRAPVAQLLGLRSFFMYDSVSQTHRIHRLFLGFLREKQAVLTQEEKAHVYHAAARWYAQNGYRMEAIAQYEKIGRYDKMADILLEYTHRLPADTVHLLLGVMDRMPDSVLSDRPMLRALYAKFLLNNFKVAEANQRLELIRHALEPLPRTEDTQAVLGEVYIMLGFLGFMSSPFTRRYEHVKYFKKADEHLPSGSRLNRGVRYYGGNYAVNVLSSEQEAMQKAFDAARQIEPYSARVLHGAGMGMEYLMRAEYACFQRDMKRAEKYAYRAIEKGREGNQFDVENHALFLLTRIAMASGSYAQIMETLRRQSQLVMRVNDAEAYAVHDITAGWFYAQIGRTDKVAEWIRDETKSNEVISPITFAADKLVRATCLLVDNKVYELLALIDRKSEGFRFEDFLFGLIEMKVLKAIALGLTKDYREAGESFQDAYELAAPCDLILPFIQNGAYMRTLIGRISDFCTIPKPWLDNIKIKSSTYSKRLGSMASEYNAENITKLSKPSLSRREAEILAGLCQGLTREELADHCGISINTIKSVIQSVFSKLGVSNSIDAVRVAALLNLME